MRTVLIVGSGIAGLSCAIHVAEQGSRALLVSPYPSERSQSVMAAGGINAVPDSEHGEDSPELHAEDTLSCGGFIASAEAVGEMCRQAPKLLASLAEMGTPFAREENGEIALRAIGGASHKRTAYAGTATGKQLVSAMVSKVREYQVLGRIERRYGLWFHSALLFSSRCYGALFFNEYENRLELLQADAVVMATGGQNALFGKTTGSTLCDGYAAARLFMQGVKLANLEFIQYHPTTLETCQKRMLISEAARSEGGRLYYLENGRRIYFMEEKFGERGNLMPRDVVTSHIAAAPSQVYLDLTHLERKKFAKSLYEVKDLCLRYAKLDVEKESIPVVPSVHFFMGGISVDQTHRTSMAGLYAVGECASLYHGANRLGGNSLLAAVYGGAVAAKSACALEVVQPLDFSDYLREQEEKMRLLLTQKGQGPTVFSLTQTLVKVMQTCLGTSRSGDLLRRGAEEIERCLSACDSLVADPSMPPYEVYRLKPQLVLARAILACALAREETRGAHVRTDFPESDERLCLATRISYDHGAYRVTFEREDAQ